MILDRGFCTIYSTTDDAEAGNMPALRPGLVKFQSWYGERNFETNPTNADKQDDTEISASVRILQCRDISTKDIAVLSSVLPPPGDAIQFEIIRAYHGKDAESGEMITDLNLKKGESVYDITGIP